MNKTGAGYSNDKDAKAAGGQAARQALTALAGEAPRVVFAFAAPSYDFGALIAGLRGELGDAPLLGCSTAGEFTHGAQGHESVAVMALAGDGMRVATGIGRGLRGDQGAAVKEAMAHFTAAYRAARAEGFSHATVFVLTDGLAGNGEQLVERVHHETNMLAQVVGGAAADAARFERTEVIYGGDHGSDAVAIASVFTRTPIGLGVQHGLSAATQPKVVTRAAGGVLYEIDGKPAYQAYEEFARQRGVQLTEANREQFMIVNELGMVTPDGHKVRAPLKAHPDGSLLMASEVPAGTAVCIMQGTSEALVAATRKAAEAAVQALGPNRPAGALMFDCICRRIFLGDDYKKQIAAVAEATGGAPVAGWETYGEIALTPTQASGFHNSTSVIAVIPT